MGQKYRELGIAEVVVKAQVLSGKRGKNNGIRFCSTEQDVVQAVNDLFNATIRGQFVAAVLVVEKLKIAAEQYLSITYDTATKQPVLVYSEAGGMDIEDVAENKIEKVVLDVRTNTPTSVLPLRGGGVDVSDTATMPLSPFRRETESEVLVVVQNLWNCFLGEDARVVEINPLVKTVDGRFVAADAKVALDEDAFYRHTDWQFEPRTMLGRLPTEREQEVKKIDEGENYYRGTAGKYIEMDGDIAILFSGGGASIANMDALIKAGCKPANYTEYSGNPPREKVYQLAKIVLSKPGLKGLWIAGGVANFTNIAETFNGIVDALDEVKPTYPIVVRRAGPFEAEGMQMMRECAERNHLNIKMFGKEKSMSETAEVLANMIA
jgi:citryl-CoA synthetase large subunit